MLGLDHGDGVANVNLVSTNVRIEKDHSIAAGLSGCDLKPVIITYFVCVSVIIPDIEPADAVEPDRRGIVDSIE